MTNHVMLDIETLDTKPSAVVASIGAVKFDPSTNELGKGVSWNLDMDQQLTLGRTVSANTLQFWFNQDKAVQESTFLTLRSNPKAVLDELVSMCKDCCVWGNGASFDNVIIHSLAETYGMDSSREPWPFWMDRCFRTVVQLFDPEKELRSDNDMRHDALADAEQQAKWLMRIATEKGIEL